MVMAVPAGTCPLGWTVSTVPGSPSLGCQSTRTARPSYWSWRRTALTGWPASDPELTSTVPAAAAREGAFAAAC